MEKFGVEPLRRDDFVEHVRRSPATYLRVERGSVELPTEIVQELVGMSPTGAPEEFPAPDTPFGSRMTFHLDPSFCGPGEAMAWVLRPEEPHGKACKEDPSPVTFPIRDLRSETGESVGA
ncbi:hypothetical protein ACGFYY_27655 [Streptomyces sp. NPDC048331]|uniref:hypothetical protein n=1 Tax=Streptomyces sp. NPDC048331 TaxID=3365534 RepID=UPI003723A7C1